MKNVIYFLIIFFIEIGYCKTICNYKDDCLCYSGSDFEIQCPKNYIDVGGILMHIVKDRILIICTKLTTFNVSLLPNITLHGINGLRMRSCPFPNEGFKEILNWFSIQSIKLLEFERSDMKNRTLLTNDFKDLGTLETLVLNEDGLIDLDEDIFINTPNINSIQLPKNNLRLKPHLFKKTHLLKFLDISRNKIEHLPYGFFQELRHLERLHLWANKLKFLYEHDFYGLSNLKSLELSANHIEYISENTFRNLINLSQINLSKNNLNTVSANLFRNNRMLEIILLEGNVNLMLPEYLFSNLFLLKKVDLSNCSLKSIPKHIFENSVNLKILKLAKNNLKQLPQTLFKGLKQLKIIFLQNNLIEKIEEDTFAELNNLEEINASKNQISEIHHRAFYKNEHLKKINLSNNKISRKHTSLGNPTLLGNCLEIEHVDFSYNLITQLDEVMILINQINLTYLDLSHNYITGINLYELRPFSNELRVILDYNSITTVNFDYIDEITSLQNKKKCTLHLSNNPFKCDCFSYDLWKYFNKEMPSKITNMFDLQINNLTCASPSDLRDLSIKALSPFLLICSLETFVTNYTGCPERCSCSWRPSETSIIIDCSNKNLTIFPEIFISHMDLIPFNQTEMHLEKNRLIMGPDRSLSDYNNVTKLFLSHNFIRTVTWLPYKLEVLTLDNNQISDLDYEILKSLSNSNLVNLTLENNPWICSCDAANLTNFLRQHAKQVNVDRIYCSNTENRLVDLNRNDLCYDWQLVHTILIMVAIGLVFAISLVLYFRYQQELKIWLFSKNLCLWWVTEEELDKDKIYDAFISYSHKDEDFVVQNLLPVLESGPRAYKLCLHYRNWIPGEFISKQITNSVFESRRTIVVLSPNFLESVWGKIEFRTAHTQAMNEKRTRVIVILYGDVNVDNLDNELKTYLRTNTYVKWGDIYFWNKLKYALPHLRRKGSKNNQKHTNVVNYIDNKFKLIAPVTIDLKCTSGNGGGTNLFKKHSAKFIPNSETNSPTAEVGSLLNSKCL